MRTLVEWACYGVTVGGYFAIMYYLYRRTRR